MKERTIAVGCVLFGVALGALAAGDKQLAFSKRLGVEFLAEDSGAGWCKPELRLRVQAQDAAVFQSPGFQALVRQVGAEVLAKQCGIAEKASLRGFTKGSSKALYLADANKADGWTLVAGRSVEAPSAGQTKAAADGQPFEDHGACPFECCAYRDWVVQREVPVYAERSVGSAVVFRLQKGEFATAVTGVVITTRPGIARVIRPIVFAGARAKVGAVVELLTYGGEGTFKLRYQGRVIDPDVRYMESLEVVSGPESIWWVKIRNRYGKVGWSNSPDSFGNKDACG